MLPSAGTAGLCESCCAAREAAALRGKLLSCAGAAVLRGKLLSCAGAAVLRGKLLSCVGNCCPAWETAVLRGKLPSCAGNAALYGKLPASGKTGARREGRSRRTVSLFPPDGENAAIKKPHRAFSAKRYGYWRKQDRSPILCPRMQRSPERS